MWLTAKFVPANDLLAVAGRGTEKAPAVAGAFLISSFNYIGLGITKNRFGGSFILLMGLSYGFLVVLGGLTCDFAEQKRGKIVWVVGFACDDGGFKDGCGERGGARVKARAPGLGFTSHPSPKIP
jgi:hypothetical protein